MNGEGNQILKNTEHNWMEARCTLELGSFMFLVQDKY